MMWPLQNTRLTGSSRKKISLNLPIRSEYFAVEYWTGSRVFSVSFVSNWSCRGTSFFAAGSPRRSIDTRTLPGSCSCFCHRNCRCLKVCFLSSEISRTSVCLSSRRTLGLCAFFRARLSSIPKLAWFCLLLQGVRAF